MSAESLNRIQGKLRIPHNFQNHSEKAPCLGFSAVLQNPSVIIGSLPVTTLTQFLHFSSHFTIAIFFSPVSFHS